MSEPRRQITIRSQYKRPAHAESLPEPEHHANVKIRLRHPAYPDSENILISLPALDDGGIHYGTAHAVCAILANFQYKGYFTLTPKGEAVDCDGDDILMAADYYFQIPGVHKWEVVANFGSSVFPHGDLHPLWLLDSLRIPTATDQPRETACNGIVLARDRSCRLVNAIHSAEGAHLLPKSEESWYTANSMFQYSTWEEKAKPDDPSNAILLRSDIHTLFDAKRIMIVPKQGKWVTHVLYGTAHDELAECYHNVPLQPLTGISLEFLFARFVWTILGLSTFPSSGGKRALLVVKPGEANPKRVEVTGMQYKADLAPRYRAASRTPSPNKRRRDERDETSVDEVDGYRGRPRRRLSESSSVFSLGSENCESFSSSLPTPASDAVDLQETISGHRSADGEKLHSKSHYDGGNATYDATLGVVKP